MRGDEGGGVGGIVVDEGNQGRCTGGVEDGKEGIDAVVRFVDGEVGVFAEPLVLFCLQGF